ncbi:MAG TPA: hypothetical protein VF941_21640 [Clostridia bacterium]
MDELSQYIFNNYSNLLTRQENIAWHYFLLNAKRHKDSAKRFVNTYHRQDIAEFINCNEEEFYVSVKNRILREHPDKIHLNYCPQCGNLTRTPRAKQCLKCKFKWHKA